MIRQLAIQKEESLPEPLLRISRMIGYAPSAVSGKRISRWNPMSDFQRVYPVPPSYGDSGTYRPISRLTKK